MGITRRGNLSVDGGRIWQSLMDLAEIGATAKGGVNRPALGELDREAREVFIRWCADAGCASRVDAMGNIFIRRPGSDPDAPPVATGSHLDTQPTGGRFDGILGVCAGLEVIRTLNDLGIETEAPIEVCVWTNEEGSRFPPAMMGSGVFAGVLGQDETYRRADRDGTTVGEALEAIGFKGELPPGHQEFGAFLELHIEQGPVLEAEGKDIGIVTNVQGTRWYDIRITGAEAHAGTTPMDMRRDALRAAGGLIGGIYAIAERRSPHGRATVGEFRAHPGSRNTVPGEVELTVDMRHPDAATLKAMHRELGEAVAAAADGTGMAVDLGTVWVCDPVTFDAACVAAVREGAEAHGYSSREIVSGAGHDAVNISRVAPAAMVFIPCEGGVSHNEAESILPADAEKGVNVLLHAMLALAGPAK